MINEQFSKIRRSEGAFWIAILPALAALGLVLSTGCTSLPHEGAASRQEFDLLRRQLLELGKIVQAKEAKALADLAVREALNLAQEYHVVRPPWFHNVLVNHGLRERGLCFDWTNDLFLRLHNLHLRSLDLHLVVARMDTPREHNSISVTAHGEPFNTGVILDAWRHSGRLFSGSLATDKYPWELLPEDRIDPEIKKHL